MYAWSHSCPDEQSLERYLKQELNIVYNGVGFYLDEKDTLLVTIQDKNGERGTGTNNPPADSRYVVYVFNVPFHQTVFSQTCRVASDTRDV